MFSSELVSSLDAELSLLQPAVALLQPCKALMSLFYKPPQLPTHH